MHDDDHVDYLVTSACRFKACWQAPTQNAERISWGGWVTADDVDPTALGRLLLAENMRSVLHRYTDAIEADEYALYAQIVETYRYRPVVHVAPATAIKAARSMAYQSCEHPEWQTSEAKAICEAIEHFAVDAMPTYRASDGWCWSRP